MSDAGTSSSAVAALAALADASALPALRLAVDLALAVLSWLVQLIIYPAFAAVDRAGFCAWHAGYTRRISRVVVPLMLLQVLLHALTAWRQASAAAVLPAGLLVVAWLATFLVAVPCHRRLGAEGCRPDVLRRLLAANAVRTVAWTAMALVSAVLVLRG